MTVVPNWRAVLTKAWSVWLMAFAAVLDVATQTVPFMSDIVPWWFIALVLVLAVAARFVKQTSVSGKGS